MFNHDKFLNLFAIFWIFLVPLELKSGHTVNLGALPCACRPGTRRIWEVCCVPAVRAHREQPPTPSAGRDGVCPLFFAVRLYIHTAKRFAVCPTFGRRQTRSLPSPRLPSATVGEVFAVCLGHTANSWSPVVIVIFNILFFLYYK